MHDAIIIGAGLAGLAAARKLTEAGRDVVVLERSDGVGGRVRSDAIDGFTLDRGFQVLLTGYPAAKELLDYAALDLRAFRTGVQLRVGSKWRTLADPLAEPTTAAKTLFSPPIPAADLARFTALRAYFLTRSQRDIEAGRNVTAGEWVADRGFSDTTIERFFRPFFGGVFLDPSMGTSSRLVESVMRSFFGGNICVPNRGMGEVTQQLADSTGTAVTLDANVTSISESADHVEVHVEGGASLTASQVIVATDLVGARSLLPAASLGEGEGRSGTTWWFAIDGTGIGDRWLYLDGGIEEPANHVAVMSNIAPGYAPAGKTLIAASSPAERGLKADDDDVRAQLRSWFGDGMTDATLLRRDDVRWAQPRMAPEDVEPFRRPVRVSDRTLVCGDHRDVASINGALVSGLRAADAVLTSAH